MTCPVSNQIAKHCDEPEQLSAWELYQFLEKNGFVVINGIQHSWEDIFGMIEPGSYEKDMTRDGATKLYIDKIAELMDD